MHIQPTHTFCNLAFSVLRFDDPKLKDAPYNFSAEALSRLGMPGRALQIQLMGRNKQEWTIIEALCGVRDNYAIMQ